MSFEGKVAIVAGAGGGMGLTIANDLIAAGAKVALADIKTEPGGIAAGPGAHRYAQGDLSDETFVNGLVADTVAAYGRLDHLVNATGVLWFDKDKSLVDMDMADQAHPGWIQAFVDNGFVAVQGRRLFCASPKFQELLSPWEEVQRSFYLSNFDGHGPML